MAGPTLDPFTITRITRFIDTFKERHGRDASEAEVIAAGFAPKDLDKLVRRGVIDKYQITTASGSRENRFKVHKDWRSLRDP